MQYCKFPSIRKTYGIACLSGPDKAYCEIRRSQLREISLRVGEILGFFALVCLPINYISRSRNCRFAWGSLET